MAERRNSEEEIKKYIFDGWNFRRKISKNREYITRRKGQVERSLGPYTDELWSLIAKLRLESHHEQEKQPEKTGLKIDQGYEARSESKVSLDFEDHIHEKLHFDRTIKMMTECLHRDREGYCTYWTWEKQPRFFKGIKQLYGEDLYMKKETMIKNKTVKQWMMRTPAWYCTDCPAYISHKNISTIKEYLTRGQDQ